MGVVGVNFEDELSRSGGEVGLSQSNSDASVPVGTLDVTDDRRTPVPCAGGAMLLRMGVLSVLASCARWSTSWAR